MTLRLNDALIPMDLLINQLRVKIIFRLICTKTKQRCQLETEGKEEVQMEELPP